MYPLYVHIHKLHLVLLYKSNSLSTVVSYFLLDTDLLITVVYSLGNKALTIEGKLTSCRVYSIHNDLSSDIVPLLAYAKGTSYLY